jgi:hypothetical protein
MDRADNTCMIKIHDVNHNFTATILVHSSSTSTKAWPTSTRTTKIHVIILFIADQISTERYLLTAQKRNCTFRPKTQAKSKYNSTYMCHIGANLLAFPDFQGLKRPFQCISLAVSVQPMSS